MHLQDFVLTAFSAVLMLQSTVLVFFCDEDNIVIEFDSAHEWTV